MKVNIWIKKEDVLSGNITEHHTHLPQVSYSSYVQVSISVDEFAKLEDVYKPSSGRSTENYTYPEYKIENNKK